MELDDDKFKILILPFSKNGTNEKGDLGAEIIPMFEDIIMDDDLNIEFHYLESVDVGLFISKEIRDSLKHCNDADIIIYGSKWYSEESGLGRISVKYDMDNTLLDINTLPFKEEVFSNQPISPLRLIGKIENKFFTRELEDIQRLEQLIFWLSCLSERGKGHNKRASYLIDKALAYDSSNVNFSSLKIACLVNMNKLEEAESFMDSVLQINSNNELFWLLYLQLKCHLNDNENVNKAYSWLANHAKNFDVLQLSHHYFYFFKIHHGNPEESLKIIEEKINKNPQNRVWKELKIVGISSTFKRGDTEGIEFIDTFLKKDSNHIGANTLMTNVLCINNQFNKASTYIDRARKLTFGKTREVLFI